MKCDNCPWSEINECYGKDVPEYKFKKDELEEIVKEAFKNFVNEDYYLVIHELNEIAIVAGFYFHIRRLIQIKYPELNVDIEYDKSGNNRKRYDNGHCARPDLIIHKRGCSKYNVLFMEFKKRGNQSRRITDYIKLKEFTKQKNSKIKNKVERYDYQYQYGMFIEIDDKGFDITWYIDGNQESHLILNKNEFLD